MFFLLNPDVRKVSTKLERFDSISYQTCGFVELKYLCTLTSYRLPSVHYVRVTGRHCRRDVVTRRCAEIQYSNRAVHHMLENVMAFVTACLISQDLEA